MVAMEWMRETGLGMVQVAEPVGVVNREVGVEVLPNSGWEVLEIWEDPGSPLASHTPEVLWRSGPAWPPRGRRDYSP